MERVRQSERPTGYHCMYYSTALPSWKLALRFMAVLVYMFVKPPNKQIKLVRLLCIMSFVFLCASSEAWECSWAGTDLSQQPPDLLCGHPLPPCSWPQHSLWGDTVSMPPAPPGYVVNFQRVNKDTYYLGAYYLTCCLLNNRVWFRI